MTPNIYSERKRKRQGFVAGTQYDEIPERVRVQVVFALREADTLWGMERSSPINNTLTYLLRKEHGVTALRSEKRNSALNEWENWFVHTASVDEALDTLDWWREAMELVASETGYYNQANAIRSGYKNGTEEINRILRRGGVGFAFVDDLIIEVGNEHLHDNAIIPAMILLRHEVFRAADDEYVKALEAYKDKRNSNAIHHAGNALESTFKIIGAKLAWGLGEKDTLNNLIDKAVAREFISKHLKDGLLGIGRVRNKFGGHGPEEEPHDPSDELTLYQLHHTASAIVMLVEGYKKAIANVG